VAYRDAANYRVKQLPQQQQAQHNPQQGKTNPPHQTMIPTPAIAKSKKQDQQEGAISGLSNLKRKLAEIDKERELYKIEQTKMEDEISTVTNSLSKLGDQMIHMRQDMTALSGNMRAELSEMKNILLGMNKNTSPPRRKTHRRTKDSESASTSSNDEKKRTATAAGVLTLENDLTWDSMCESEAEHNIRPPPVMVTLSNLEDFDLNGVDTGS
jgi:hypothetical protein